MIVAAANSTCRAIQSVGTAFSAQHSVEFEYICKSSGLLAKGLNGGAISADYYISANAKWMDVMVDAGLIQRDMVQSLWGNELVVAAPLNSSLSVDKLSDLASRAVALVYIGDPSTAPFGRYTKQALVNAQVWDSVKTKITTQKHVTLLAENLSKAKANALGILFSTNMTQNMRPVLKIDSSLHDPIHYFSGPIAGAEGKKLSHAFGAFLKTEEAQNIFRDHGFKLLP